MIHGFRQIIAGIIFIIVAFGIPGSLTVMNTFYLFTLKGFETLRRICWALTIICGLVLSAMYSVLVADFQYEPWDKAILYGFHEPIWSEGRSFYLIVCLLSLLGFIILDSVEAAKTPPLVTVLCMAPQYLMMGACVVWCIQIKDVPEGLPLMVLPLNIIIMILSVIRCKINEWNSSVEHDEALYGKNKFLYTLNKWLAKAALWPVWTFVALIPILGVILLILTLFGQQPDIIVKAWTETADFTFSQRIAPPNLPYEGHYLCTVAARGHKGLVRPLRYGERNGTVVVVNRQLEIANAFEQVLEERTPRFHRAVRNFYDKHGLPIARVIRTKFSSDVVYILMKPLEWIFLVVLYLTDANPENRIHVQYLPGYRNFLKAK
ncbi:MAG: hypothetical protein IKR39_10335 [Lachnospiraceae bacterium]|nr:hypothetical protein [Lachnospiraceae bacterium]